jgi:hypothetical protein
VKRALLVLSIAIAACSKDEPKHDDGAIREAALRKEDRARLERIVALDVTASQALRAADDAAMKGDAGAAVDQVHARALPALDEALRDAEGPPMKTAWGTQRKDALVGVLKDRKAEMPRYEEAVKSGDPEKMLTAVQAQAAIERRALGAVAAVQDER